MIYRDNTNTGKFLKGYHNSNMFTSDNLNYAINDSLSNIIYALNPMKEYIKKILREDIIDEKRK